MALTVKLRVGETLPLDNGRIRLTLEDTRKGGASVRVDAPLDVRVGRVYGELSPPPTGRNERPGPNRALQANDRHSPKPLNEREP